MLDRFVSGVNLMPGSLRDQLGAELTLLVFLRHLGCIFRRETIAELRDASRARGYPRVIFFFQGTPTEGRAFLRRDWPEARGPGVLAAGLRARRKGFENGERSGHVFRMPGALVKDGAVLWRHRYRHAGDRPDFANIPPLAREPVSV